MCGYLKVDNEELFLKGLVDRGLFEEFVYWVKRRVDLDFMKNMCKLLVVVDYCFYRYMGRGEESIIINYLIELIDRVDDIYWNILWDNVGFKGYGI